MAASLQDIKKGIDLTGVGASATGSQLNQLVDAGAVGDDRGMIVETTDTVLDTPDVPDAATNTKWRRFIWRRVPHATATDTTPILYIWKNTATSVATYLKWVVANYGNAIQALDNSLPVKAFDIIIKRPQVDPRYFGADDTGVANSTVAIRKAIYYANSIGGSVKFKAGTYLLNRVTAYGVDESAPYKNGLTACDRERFHIYLPVPSNMAITADGDATLKIAPQSAGQTGNYVMSSRGFTKSVFDGLIIDGDYPSHAIVVPNYPGGAAAHGIGVGNQGIIRNCSFKRMGGCSPGLAITAGYPQVSIVPGEYYSIVAANDCLIEGNVIRDSWGGGIIAGGSNNLIRGNIVEDVANQCAAVFFPYYGSIYDLMTGDQSFLIDYSMAGLQDYYKGKKLGTRASIASGCFVRADVNNYYTDAQLLALGDSTPPSKLPEGGANNYTSNEYDKSAFNYWAKGNVFEGNIFSRAGQDLLHLERALATIIRGNKFTQGIPKLLNPSGQVFPVVGESILTESGACGISSTSLSMDTTVEGNDVFLKGNGTYLNKAGEATVFAAFSMIGYGQAFDNVYYSAGNSQDVLQELRFGNNKVFNRYTGFDKILLQETVTNGQGQIFGLCAMPVIEGDGFYQATDVPITNWPVPVNEVTFTGGSAGHDVMMDVEPFIFPIGKFNFLNTQGAISYEKDMLKLSTGATYGHYSANPNLFGTKRTNFRLMPVRRDTLWQMKYKLRIIDKVATSLVIELEGTIQFKYTVGSIVTFVNDISYLNFQNGSIEIVPYYNNLFPANQVRPSRRTISAQYRGGLAFYCNTNDTTKYAQLTGNVSNISNNIAIHFSGETIELC